MEGRIEGYCFWLALASCVHLVKLHSRILWSSISLQEINLYIYLVIVTFHFFFIYFLAPFIKLCSSPFSYDLLIKSLFTLHHSF